MNELSIWIRETIERELEGKIQATILTKEIEDHSEKILTCIDEIQQAIEFYNQKRTKVDHLSFPKELFINASHLASIWKKPLPDYKTILNTLSSDLDLSKLVFTELRESSYFKEVYKIDNSWYLIQNLLILFYRTSLLFLYPTLRQKGAQISSTIEEMSCAMALENTRTHLFDATKQWIKNWEEEEFSPNLAQVLKAKKLL